MIRLLFIKTYWIINITIVIKKNLKNLNRTIVIYQMVYHAFAQG